MTTTPRKLFVNLPVKDLQASVRFFTGLGFSFDPQFTDEHATCMVLSDEAFVMLLDQPRFRDFTSKQLCDTTTSTEAIFALSAESREEVDQLVDAAMGAGAGKANEPQDHGFMYGRSFTDLDGHTWEVMWMDTSALTQDAPGA